MPDAPHPPTAHSVTSRAKSLLERVFCVESDPLNLAVARVVVFGILLRYVAKTDFLTWSRIPAELRVPFTGWGWFFDSIPMADGFVRAVQIVAVASLGCAFVGFRARLSALIGTCCALYLLALPRMFGHTSSTQNHLVWFGFVLSASRCADALSIDAWLARRKGRGPWGASRSYGLPLRLMWCLLGVAYFFPGLGKLLAGPDWWLGDTIRNFWYEDWRAREWLPAVRIDEMPWVYRSGAILTMLWELSFGVLVFVRKLRPWALVGGVLFHGLAAYLMQIYFGELVACYAIFIDWAKVRDWASARMGRTANGTAPRVPPNPAGIRSAAWVGGSCVALLLFVGIFQIRSWPFTKYPSFSSLKAAHEETLEVTVRATDGSTRPARYPKGLRHVVVVVEERAAEGVPIALEAWLRALQGANDGAALELHRIKVSLLPADHGAPPLSREFLLRLDAVK